jgi:GTP-binding protein
MIDFHKAAYIISAPRYEGRPQDNLPEIVFLGRSNVGKSTLINSLVGTKIAFSSKRAGKTKILNYFKIDDRFYLVDAPGYGYTDYGTKEIENFGEMMETYFDNPQLIGALLLFDCRRVLTEDDRSMLSFLRKKGLPFILVYTKCDRAKQSELALAHKEAESLHIENAYYSSEGHSADELRGRIAKMLEVAK